MIQIKKEEPVIQMVASTSTAAVVVVEEEPIFPAISSKDMTEIQNYE